VVERAIGEICRSQSTTKAPLESANAEHAFALLPVGHPVPNGIVHHVVFAAIAQAEMVAVQAIPNLVTLQTLCRCWHVRTSTLHQI